MGINSSYKHGICASDHYSLGSCADDEDQSDDADDDIDDIDVPVEDGNPSCFTGLVNDTTMRTIRLEFPTRCVEV